MTRRILCSAVLAMLGVPLVAQPTRMPQEPTVFRTATRLVVRTVDVKDRDGHAIEGLTAADFTVEENGEPQEVAFVEFQRLGGRTGDMTNTPTRVEVSSTAGRATNAGDAQPRPGKLRYHNRRLVVLYFDLSAMPEADQLRAYDGALTFIDQYMEPADLLAIVTFEHGAVRVQQQLTDDRDRLRQTLQRLVYGGRVEGVGGGDPDGLSTPFGQNDAEFNVFNTDRQLSALQTAAETFSGQDRRTTLVYFGSGLRLNGRDNRAQYRATVNAAIRANVTINPVDARGLATLPLLGDASVPSPSGLGVFSGTRTMTRLWTYQTTQDTLHALAGDTGGRAMFDDNDLSAAIARLTREAANYYVLGYYSTHPQPDGRIRRVRISLAGDRSADVTYRRAYFGDKMFAEFSEADRERQLEEALASEYPLTDLTLAIELNHFQLNSAEYYVPVFVKIPGSQLKMDRRRRGARVVVDFIGEVRTAHGVTIQNVRDRVDIRLTGDTLRQLAARPMLYETGFSLLPDDYVLKILARDAETGRIGTYETPFTIPNLEREERLVPISSVVLGGQWVAVGEELHRVEQRTETRGVNPLVRNGAKLVPSVTRVFTKNSDLQVFLEAYQRAPETRDRPLIAFVSLYRDSSTILQSLPLIAKSGADARPWAVPLSVRIPLRDLSIGPYQCQVSVLDPTGQKVAFWRAPLFIGP